MQNKMKLVFFVKQGLDSFLDNVIKNLSINYETKKIVVAEYSEIDKGMVWADICWFEWCDELMIYGSKLDIAKEKKIICRIHSYEAFTDYPANVCWKNVDRIIFVAEHIKNLVTSKFNIDESKTVVIPNGVNINNYTYCERKSGFNIAYAGFINYKKGPMLLLHTFKAIYDFDNRYKLFIAGQFQDERDILYFEHTIKILHLENNIIYDGWQNHLDKWLEDKNFIICTSILESQNMSIMQAMSKGIKPLIHNFVGSSNIYPDNYIFSTIDEAVSLLQSDYNSNEYRNYIEKYFSLDKTNDLIKSVLKDLQLEEYDGPLVSVVMAVYNRQQFLRESIESILNQSYKNIELLIINDGSTDNSENIIKSFSDKRIRYFYRNNSGQLDALKLGFKLSNGEFITRVDSDDKIDRDYIKICVTHMKQDISLQFLYTDFTLIDKSGKKIEEIKFTTYANPYKLLDDVFNRFSSVIPDVAFWSKNYIDKVILNYTEQNIPFYIDDLLVCKFKHINKPIYYYRQHESNFASNVENFKLVIKGKIKFIDFVIRRYLIQLNLNNDFEVNKVKYINSFAEKYINLSKVYEPAGNEIVDLFLKEAVYWLNCLMKITMDENILKDIKKRLQSITNTEASTSTEYFNKNKRVMIVSTDDPNEGKAVGGKHVHIYLLQKGLAEYNIPTFLTTFISSGDISINIQEFCKSFNFKPEALQNLEDSNFIYLVYVIQTQLEDKVERKLKDSYISCINCHDVIATMAAHNVRKKLNINIPIITTLHGYFTYENHDYGAIKKDSLIYSYFLDYEKRAYEISDKIITVDSRIKQYVINLLIHGEFKSITVLKNAVNNLYFDYNSNNQDSFKNNIFFVPRRLVPKNGVIYAVKAACILLSKGIKNFKLLIAGDGNERTKIEQYIDENKLQDFVNLLGSIPHDKINSYFDSAKAIIIPSIYSNNVEEATSIAALEGMSCGKIVIAGNIGGLKELIKNEYSGFLINSEDPYELAAIFERVIDMNIENYNFISKNARKDIELNYGYLNHTKKYIECFDESMERFL